MSVQYLVVVRRGSPFVVETMLTLQAHRNEYTEVMDCIRKGDYKTWSI